MIKEFIPYELALELKQLGFDKPCLAYWCNETPTNPEGQCLVYYKKPWDNQKIINGIIRDYYVAPTYSQTFRWFREKHNLKSCIMFRTSMVDNEEYYDWLIKGQEVVYRHFKTYEEAELACIKELIKIVKTHEGGNK